MKTEPTDYEWLLECLAESRERLRVMQVQGEQENVDIAKAFYRIDLAVAAIRGLLAETARNSRPITGRRSSWASL